MITINTDKAKDIQRDAWRKVRKAKLAELDIEFMKAVESGDTTLQSEIASKKQALRDVTLTDLPDVPGDIRSTWPEILN